MKTVTTAFLTAWINKGAKFEVQRIDYKRRYYNGAAVVYEAAWQSLTMPGGAFKSLGTMTWSLAAILDNEFTSSNCSVQLLNSDYRWTPENTSGVFGADATAPLGYIAKGTMMQVYAGLELADGTFEYLSMFSGLLTDYSAKPMEGVFEAFIGGYEEYLLNGKAENVSTAFTNEALTPAPDGTNKIFTTTSIGVAYVTGIRDNAAAKVEGVDYTVSNLDSVFGATVTFVVAPIAAHALDATGLKWKAAQSLDTLAGLLCDEAGVTAGNRTIDPIIIPGGVSGSKTFDTQADWLAGSVMTDADALSSAGDLLKKWFLLDDFAVDLSKWTIASLTNAITGGQWQWTAITDLALGVGYASIPSTVEFGTWELKMTHAGADVAQYNVGVVRNGANEWYGFSWSLVTNTAWLSRGIGFTDVALGTPFSMGGAGQKTLRATRNSAGYMELYLGGVLMDTTTSLVNGTGVASFWAYALLAGGGAIDMKFDDIRVSTVVDPAGAFTNDGVWESAEQNILSVPTAWAAADHAETLNGGTVVYAMASSTTSGGAYSAYTDLVADIPQCPLRQFFKLRITRLPASAYSLASPSVARVVVGFQTTSVSLAIAIFRGMDCYTALQGLAFLCGYELGFDNTGRFFFRSKSDTAAPILTFNQTDILAKILEIKPGWNEVINDAQVTNGASYKEYTSSSLPETAPTSQDIYYRKLTTQSVPFILANDANIASGLARNLHDALYRARRRVSFECRIIPQADIGDVMQISFYEDPLLKDNVWGDPLINWAPIFGVPMNVALRDFKCRIIELTHDFDAGVSRILGVEVL